MGGKASLIGKAGVAPTAPAGGWADVGELLRGLDLECYTTNFAEAGVVRLEEVRPPPPTNKKQPTKPTRAARPHRVSLADYNLSRCVSISHLCVLRWSTARSTQNDDWQLVSPARSNAREFRNWLRDIGIDKLGHRERVYDALSPLLGNSGAAGGSA